MRKRIDRLSADSFDWVLLRSFLAIYRAGTVAAAARTLSQQQPTLSRHLMELENQLGKPLFERNGRGLVATDTAHLVAEYARQMEESANRLTLALVAKATDLTGVVRLTASHIASTWLLPPIMTDLLQRQPGLELELAVSDELHNLLGREADIAVRMVRPTQLDLVTRKIGEVTMVMAARADYLEQHGTPQSPADLLRHQLLGYDKDQTIMDGMVHAGLPVTQRHFRFRCDDDVEYLEMVRAGAGIGVIHGYMLHTGHNLRHVLPGLPIPPISCWLTVHKDIFSNPLVRWVFDELAILLGARLQAGLIDVASCCNPPA
ncbi:MAG: hypothetical protein RL748_2477 [Pseudomonadota bacterium]|jgi:DNA-binding transcriptional LysR family regulator